jgi:hypothetical protein
MISFGLKQLWRFLGSPHPGGRLFFVMYFDTKEVDRVQPSGRLRELLQNLRSLDGGTPESNPEPSLPSPPSIYHAQYSTLWTTPSSDQSPVLRPGMSIEQLLASVGEPSYTEPSYAVESILDDQLMSIWMSGLATWREPHFVLHLSAKPQFQQQNQGLGRTCSQPRRHVSGAVYLWLLQQLVEVERPNDELTFFFACYITTGYWHLCIWAV